MQPRAGGTGEGCKAPSLLPQLLLKIRLYVHARLGASKNDQVRHHRRMTVRADFILDLDQFWNRSRLVMTAQGMISQKRRGPEGPFRCHQRR